MKEKILIPILLSVVFIGCTDIETGIKKVENEKFCLDDSFKEKIETEFPVIQTVTESIPLTGSVEPNPDKVIHFMSLVNGIISNTYFSLGDKVTKGQVLAELRSVELAELQTEQKNLEVQIEVAENKLQSVQSMFDDGISSQRDLLEARSELSILRSQLQKVIATMNIYSASSERGVFQIKAPASGIITSKSIAAGSQISAEGESLFTISDLSEVWVLVNIYATNLSNVEQGMPVEIRTLSYPDEVFNGVISSISQVYDDEARVLKARVVLHNKNSLLKPGMLVDVTGKKERQVQAVSIPTNAVIFDDNQNYVVIYESDCDMKIRKLEILSKNNGVTYIASGLSENEQVISKNQLLIYEQLKAGDQ